MWVAADKKGEPGPGHGLHSYSSFQNLKGGNFGVGRKDSKEKSITPGPGQYNTNTEKRRVTLSSSR